MGKTLITICEKSITIDNLLVPYIVKLNEHGYYTSTCCSGAYEDHPKKLRTLKEGDTCSIGFIHNLSEEKLSRIEKVCNDLNLLFYKESFFHDVIFVKKEYFLRAVNEFHEIEDQYSVITDDNVFHYYLDRYKIIKKYLRKYRYKDNEKSTILENFVHHNSYN